MIPERVDGSEIRVKFVGGKYIVRDANDFVIAEAFHVDACWAVVSSFQDRGDWELHWKLGDKIIGIMTEGSEAIFASTSEQET